MEYGITDKGFVVKPFDTILEENKTDLLQVLDPETDLSTESVLGQYVYNSSLKIYQLWQILGDLYRQTSVSGASGVYLDRVGHLVNVNRIGATATEVRACVYSKNNVIVPNGHKASDWNGLMYSSNDEFTISSDNFQRITLSIENIGEYTLTLDSKSISFVIDDVNTHKAQFINAVNFEFPNIFTFNNSGETTIDFYSRDGIGKHSLSISDESKIRVSKVGTIGTYVCSEKGANVCQPGQLNTINESLTEIAEIYNYIDGTIGVNTESDTSYRNSILTKQKNSSASETAIVNEVLKLDNVSYARIYSNRSMSYVGSRPPKSFEVVVIGGNDEDIAKAIFRTGPAGIEAYGTTIITVVDEIQGSQWNIGFSRPVNKYVWVDVKYELNHEEELSENIEDNIKEQIMQWSINNINVGTDMIYQKLFTPIYTQKGIKSCDVKWAITDTLIDEPEWTTENIIIGDVELPVFNKERINVEAK